VLRPARKKDDMSTDDELLTIADVARLRRESTRTVRRRIAEGLIPAHRVGPRAVRIKAEDALADMRRIPAAS
jgi:excisionase family DNA binding protein